MVFLCDKCGLCCNNLPNVGVYKSLHSGNGKCKYYSSNVGCLIYEERPIFCRVDDGYDAFFKGVISKEEYYNENVKVCNNLKNNNVEYNKGIS